MMVWVLLIFLLGDCSCFLSFLRGRVVVGVRDFCAFVLCFGGLEPTPMTEPTAESAALDRFGGLT
jgi:hypothetical protein